MSVRLVYWLLVVSLFPWSSGAEELVAIGCSANQVVTATFSCSKGWSPVVANSTACVDVAGLAAVKNGAVALVRSPDNSVLAARFSGSNWTAFSTIFTGWTALFPIAVGGTSDGGAFAVISSFQGEGGGTWAGIAGGKFDGNTWQASPDMIFAHGTEIPAVIQTPNGLTVGYRYQGPKIYGSDSNGTSAWTAPAFLGGTDDHVRYYMVSAPQTLQGFELVIHDDHAHVYSYPGRIPVNDSPVDDASDFTAARAQDGTLLVAYVNAPLKNNTYSPGPVYVRSQVNSDTAFSAPTLVDPSPEVLNVVLTDGVCGDVAELLTTLTTGETHHFRLGNAGWGQMTKIPQGLQVPNAIAIH